MLRVLSLNIHRFSDRHGPWTERRARIVDGIRAARPDLVALQAVARDPAVAGGLDGASQLALDLPGYTVVYRAAERDRDGQEHGLAILSRGALADVRVHPLDSAAGEDRQTRVLLHARAATCVGLLHLVNANFSWVEAQARRNVGDTLAYLGSLVGPRLLVGDFNQTPDSEALARLCAAGLVDVWPALHPDAPGHTFYERGGLTRRIDYALADAGLAERLRHASLILDAPGERRASDHAGLVVTFAGDP